jgi:hypothetical protein
MIATPIKIALFALLALVLLLGQGCSNDVTEAETVSDDVLNLTDTYGGYQATGEAPGFGDPELLSLEGSEPANDPVAGTALVDSLGNLPNRDVYMLELLWGQLQYDSSVTTATDWSGSLTVERGAVVAARLIQFEAGDYLVRPRPNAQMAEWVSQTGPHFDGILFFIYDPEPDSFDTENTVTLNTASYSRTFTMSELVDIEEIVDVGENQVSISGFQTVPLECGEGFLAGRWLRLPNERGRFQGHWISSDGYLLGHLRGHFGIRDDGEQVMFGKWISIGGAFRGLLRGEWGYDPEIESLDAATGWLNGRWDNAAGTKLGDFGGNWVSLPPPPRDGNGIGYGNGGGNGDGVCDSTGNVNRDRPRPVGHGAFNGQWHEICEEAEE